MSRRRGFASLPDTCRSPRPHRRDSLSRGCAEPSTEQLAEARELASPIEDEELRERVAKAAALSLATARSDRRF